MRYDLVLLGRVKTAETSRSSPCDTSKSHTPLHTAAAATPCASVRLRSPSCGCTGMMHLYRAAQAMADCSGFCRRRMSSYSTCGPVAVVCATQICASTDSDSTSGTLNGRQVAGFGRCLNFSGVSIKEVCSFNPASSRGSDAIRRRVEAASIVHGKQCHHPRVFVPLEMMYASAHERDRF
jgi:hypothetical protein